MQFHVLPLTNNSVNPYIERYKPLIEFLFYFIFVFENHLDAFNGFYLVIIVLRNNKNHSLLNDLRLYDIIFDCSVLLLFSL